MKQLHSDKFEALKVQQDILKSLNIEEMISQKLKLQLQCNTTLSDNLQLKLQKLQLERATLQSSISHIREKLLNYFFPK